MNDAVWPWFWALSPPLNPQLMPVYGSLTPSTGNGPVGIRARIAVVDVGAQVVLRGSRSCPSITWQRACTTFPLTTHALVRNRIVQLRPGNAVLGGAGPLPGVEELAALVQVGARLEHEVVRQPRRVARRPAGLAGDEVVALVPDDCVVVSRGRPRWSGACRPIASTSYTSKVIPFAMSASCVVRQVVRARSCSRSRAHSRARCSPPAPGRGRPRPRPRRR